MEPATRLSFIQLVVACNAAPVGQKRAKRTAALSAAESCVTAVLIDDPLQRMTQLGGRIHMPYSLGSVYAGSVTRYLPALSLKTQPTNLWARYDAYDVLCIAAVRDDQSSSVRAVVLFDQITEKRFSLTEKEAVVLCETGDDEPTWAKLDIDDVETDLLCALPTPGVRGCFAIIPSAGNVALQSDLCCSLYGRRKRPSATPHALSRMRDMLTRTERRQLGAVLLHCCANERYMALLYARHWPGADETGACIRVLPREAAMAAGAKPCQFGDIDLAAALRCATGATFGRLSELGAKFRTDFCSMCFLPDGEHIAVADSNVSCVFVFHVAGTLVRTITADPRVDTRDFIYAFGRKILLGINRGCCSIACTGQELLVLLNSTEQIAVIDLATMEHAAVLHVPTFVEFIAACGATVYAVDSWGRRVVKWTAA